MGVPKRKTPSDRETLAELLRRIEPLAREGGNAAAVEGEAVFNVEDALRRLGERDDDDTQVHDKP